MKHFISFFIYTFLAFFCSFGQNWALPVSHKALPQKICDKYTKWQGYFMNKKSYLLKSPTECTNISSKRPKFNFNLAKNGLKNRRNAQKRVHLFVHSGQRLNKALSFSGKAFLLQISQNLLFMPAHTNTDRVSFFKVGLETLSAPETRTGVFTNIILQNDTHRINNIISSNIDARLRPYSAINQRTGLFLLGLNILL